MPLFGSKHKHDHTQHEANLNDHHHTGATGTTATSTRGHHTSELPPSGAIGAGVGVPMGSAAGMTQNYPGPGNNTSLTGGHGVNHHHNVNDPYTAGGVGHTGYSTTSGPGGSDIPPSQHVRHGDHMANTNTTSTTSGTGTRLTGKVESALGSALGSSALKAKGMEKQREADAVKMQSVELAEAERLEKEALMRRERAVGHGAHPANSKLGAGGIGPTGNY